MTFFLKTEAAHAFYVESRDLFAVATLTSIHQSMIDEPGRLLRPTQPFDMLFFYCTALEAVAQFLNWSLSVPIPKCQKSRIINLPDLDSTASSESYFVSSGLAATYLDVIQRQNVAGGMPFDASYAAAISALAFRTETLKTIETSKGKIYEPKDDWDTGQK